MPLYFPPGPGTPNSSLRSPAAGWQWVTCSWPPRRCPLGSGRCLVAAWAAPVLAQVKVPDQGGAAQQGQGNAHPNGCMH